MKATRIIITATRRVGAPCGACSATGLRDLGDRVRLRSRHRTRAARRRDARRPARHGGADVRDVGEGAREAGRAPRRPVRADVPDDAPSLAGVRPGRAACRSASNLRFFGDGWQISKMIGGTRYWRVPVMDGEFVVRGDDGTWSRRVGGGNLLFLARDTDAALAARRGRRRRDAARAERDHAVSGRRRALGLEGRLQVCRAHRRRPTTRSAPRSAARRESELRRTSRACWKS